MSQVSIKQEVRRQRGDSHLDWQYTLIVIVSVKKKKEKKDYGCKLSVKRGQFTHMQTK